MRKQSNSFPARIKRLRKKEFRDAYVQAHVQQGLAYQIRALRRQRGWSQADLARAMGTRQSAISRIEDPAYGGHSFKLLSQLSSVFDVALMVRFVSFGRLLQETEHLGETDLQVQSFDQETAALEGQFSQAKSNYSIALNMSDGTSKTIASFSTPAGGTSYMEQNFA